VNKVESDYEQLRSGINKLLGKEEYDKPEPITECTTHQSDGFIYDDEPNPIETTLLCTVCGQHYTVPSTTINLDMINNASQV
jgi:hypothetical protein